MKFWLTVVFGVVAVAAGSTAMIVLNPTVQPEPAESSTPEAAIDPEKSAIAEIVDNKQEIDHGRVGQRQKGQDVFKIRNAGKAPLIITPMKSTCQCTDVFLTDREPSPSEPAPDLKHQRADFVANPGQTVFVVARWDTKDKLGKQNVGVPVALTNDPRKTQIQFRIHLDVHKEFIQTPERFEFGIVNERQKSSLTATITSLVREKFDVERIDVGAKGFTAKAVPMTAAELKEAGAKSGHKIVLETTGENPVGPIDTLLGAVVKTAESAESLHFLVSGRVAGDIETDPPSAVIDFKEVLAQAVPNKKVKKTVTIFARNLKDSETLRLGTVKPAESFAATLEKHPKFKMWTLTVSIKPDAPGGTINDGAVTVVDSSGRERLVFGVKALIDPSFATTAAR